MFVKAKDRSNYLEIQCQFSGIKTWRKFIRFALEYSVSSPVFDIIAFHQPSLGTRAQNSVLDCECLKSLQIYFDYLLKMIVSAWNCCISRSFLKIISNEVARSLTVASGFEMLFAKISLDIFRFTIYWSEIDKKYIENKIWFSKQYYLCFLWNNCIYFVKFYEF